MPVGRHQRVAALDRRGEPRQGDDPADRSPWLAAPLQGLRDARHEAEEMRAYIERMHANG